MNRKYRYLIASFIFLFVIFQSVVFADSSVGVKKGDWIEYNVTYTGTPELAASLFRFEVLDVNGTIVTTRGTTNFSNGTKETENYIVDITVESWSQFDGFIIPSPVSDSGSFYSGEVSIGNFTVAGVGDRTYGGAKRTVIYANLTRNDGTDIFYYDQSLGVLLEFQLIHESFTLSVEAENTNMWQAQTSEMEQIILLALVVLAVIIVSVTALIFVRRKK